MFGERALSGIPLVKNVKELKGAQIDAVYVTTPAATHYPVITTIYEKGISNNIFVEKPFTFDHLQSNELCELAEQNKGITMVGYMKRFAPTFKMARSYIDEGKLGKVTSFAGHSYSSDFCSNGDFIPQAFARGDVLRDIGCHALDMMLWMLGDMDVLSAELTMKNNAQLSYVDSAHVKINCSNSSEGTFDASWSRANYRLPEIGINVIGTLGKINVTEDLFEFHSNTNKESVNKMRPELEGGVPFFLAESDYYHEDRHFVDSLNSGNATSSDFSCAANTDLIIEKILKMGHHG